MENKATIELNEDITQQMKKIGAKVRELRKQQEPNYQKWALINGINKVSLARLENGENVTMKLLLSILHKLSISYHDFNQYI
ncbi:MAG: transcriptional regulator [Bacteroidia bacterium]